MACVFCQYVSGDAQNSEAFLLKSPQAMKMSSRSSSSNKSFKFALHRVVVHYPVEDIAQVPFRESSAPHELLQTDQLIIFRDIRPAARQHLLACPVRHIPDAKHLTKADAALVESLVEAGLGTIEKLGGGRQETRVGIHWPPFCFVKHFHVHFIWPESDLTWLSRLIFRSNSYWFCSIPSLMEYLRNLSD